MSTAMNAIEVSNVSKYYALADSQFARLRRIFSPVHRPHSAAGHPEPGPRDICALRDVSFTVPRGEALGIIGANGSGKSTLLQIVTGILKPTRGSVRIDGRCAALLELGSGFAPEFSGRQNVYLNGTILGLSQEEIDSKFESIHRFSGIGDFVDQPIRTYSTGMVLRLAFAVVAHSDPRLLIVDEALAVGDIAFRQRCMRRIHEMRADGVTILFVSHDTHDIKALCERCLWLERGHPRAFGEADEVVARYLATTVDRSRVDRRRSAHSTEETALPSFSEPAHDVPATAIGVPNKGTHRFGNRAAEVTGLSLAEKRENDSWLRVRVTAKQELASPILGFLVRNAKGETIFGSNSARENHPLPAMKPLESLEATFHLTMPRLSPGKYSVSVAIADGSLAEYDTCDYIEDAASFEVPSSARPVAGYMELTCSAIAIHRS
jgi:ABC-type polysaccharide/polyol phosphate transport system ATPase subunit